MSAKATYTHQQIIRSIFRFLDNVLSSGEVLFAPLSIHFGEVVVQPDLFYINESNHRCILRHDDTIEGPPDLVVEIVTEDEEEAFKASFDVYEQHGIRELWVIKPEKLKMEMYMFVDGKFIHHGKFRHDENFRSLVLGGKTIDIKMLLGEYLEQHYAFAE